MVYTVIYIPGLFDKTKWLLSLQRQLLRSWNKYGLRVELFPMHWTSEEETFDERFKALLARIDELHKAGEHIVLAGGSAGASAALCAFIERKEKVRAMISICGELKGPEEVPEKVLDINPRFEAVLKRMDKDRALLSAADRQRVLALRPLLDEMVERKEAFLAGAENAYIPFAGHIASIGFAMLFEGKRIKRFVSR